MGIVIWLALTSIGAHLMWLGIRFHRGLDRSPLRNYRNPRASAVMRNGRLTDLAVGAMLVAFGAAAVPFIVFPDLTNGREIRKALLLGAVAWITLVMAVYFIASYQPPARMLPRWLRQEDADLGFTPRAADWFDRSLLALGIVGLLVAAGLLVHALSQLSGA